MRITELTLGNWRNFQCLDFALRHRVFIIGQNAAGKSNVLDALRFLRDIASAGGGLRASVHRRGGLARVRSLYAEQTAEVSLTVRLDDGTLDEQPRNRWLYSLVINADPQDRTKPVVVSERVEKNDEILLQRPDNRDIENPVLLTQTALEQVSANLAFRPVAEFLNRIAYFHPVPRLMRLSALSSTAGDEYGASFVADIGNMDAELRRDRIDKLERMLKMALPDLRAVSFVRDEGGAPHLSAVFKHWSSAGEQQFEDAMSDGMLRLIGLLWQLIRLCEGGSTVLLLEEPELSVSESLVQLLPGLLWSAQEGSDTQVIVTTHSTALLTDEGIAPDEVLFLRAGADGTSGKTLRQLCHDDETAKVLSDLRENPLEVARATLADAEPQRLYAVK